MNSRQRRGVLLLLLSVLCALAAFAGVISVINNVNSKVGPEVTAYELKTTWRPYGADGRSVHQGADTAALAAEQRGIGTVGAARKDRRHRAAQGVPAPGGHDRRAARTSRGQQEIAIMIDAATGVAGKITPGDLVNIFATFAGKEKGDPDQSRIIVPNAKVIDVGRLTAAGAQGTAIAAAPPARPCPSPSRSTPRTPSVGVRGVLRRARAARPPRQGQPGHLAPRGQHVHPRRRREQVRAV